MPNFAVLIASSVGSIVGWLVEAYVIILIARALVSWFPVHPGTAFYSVVRVLDSITEPVLRPIRRLLPPVRAGGMAIDLSIIVAVIGLEIIASVVLSRV